MCLLDLILEKVSTFVNFSLNLLKIDAFPTRLELQILLRPRSKIKTKHLEVNLSGLVEASMSRFKNNPIIK